MSPRDTLEFLALAAIWGASFLFTRVAAPEFGPIPLMLVRCVIGAAIIVPGTALTTGMLRAGSWRGGPRVPSDHRPGGET